jgi:phosphate transport system substrate-binding protein
MTNKVLFAALAAALALAGCGGGGSGGGASQLHIVGSSTVYPFTTAVAEEFQRANEGMSAIVESTGTGAGLSLFCGGVGDDFPDFANASRRIKKSEAETCVKNGVRTIVEVPIGIDGLALIQGNDGPAFALTPEQVYKAVAANPYGKPNTAKAWRDVDPALPAVPIRVYGPPTTSGTRDSFAELILEKGCKNDEMDALKKQDEARHKEVCTKVREDGPWIDSTENDNLLIGKVGQNPGSIGILGYSFMEENKANVRGIPLGGVAPTAETIASLQYPGARMLYVYAKGEHVDAVPGMREFLAAYARAWSKGGYLEKRGLIPAPADAQAKAATAATQLTPLDVSGLK